MKLFFLFIGLIFILEGVPYFAFPDKMKIWMKKVQEVSDAHLRIMGFIAMCMGLIMVYVFR